MNSTVLPFLFLTSLAVAPESTGLTQQQIQAVKRLPAPPTTTVTKQVPVMKQVEVIEKKLVPICVCVRPPGLFRRPCYELRYVIMDHKSTKTVAETKSVQEVVAWIGTEVFGFAKITNLPALSGGRVQAVYDKTKEIMTTKGMLPVAGTVDPETGQDLRVWPDLANDTIMFESTWFDHSVDTNKRFQLLVTSAISQDTPTTNTLLLRLHVREHPKQDDIRIVKSSEDVASAILADVFKTPPFPYPVTR